jgi:hypothetical protein
MSRIIYQPGCNLPDPTFYRWGTVVECGDHYHVGGNPGNPFYAAWRRLGPIGIWSRRLAGRIP